MKLELAQVRHVAKLARLALSPEEEARLVKDLSMVLDAVDALAAVDVTGVEPTAFVIAADMTGPVRPDVVRDELSVQQALANAPEQHEGAFTIPRVIE